MSTKWYLVYPGGDRTKIKPVEIADACSYELTTDYDPASRQSFGTIEEAHDYGRGLAREHGLQFVANSAYQAYLD
jgi:hypothetical protein